MDKGLQDKILQVLYPNTPKHIFSEDDLITREIVEFIQGLDKKGNISRLFAPTKSSGNLRRQMVEVKCDRCGTVFIDIMSRQGIESYLRDKSAGKNYCTNCKGKILLEQAQLRAQQETANKERTQEYIDTFLDPDKAWISGTPVRTQMATLYDSRVDYATVKGHILVMPYEDFLRTPYWVAIAAHVRQRNHYMCEMCGATNKTLHVHHPYYSFHGEELQNTHKLKCLCEDCHKKFHVE